MNFQPDESVADTWDTYSLIDVPCARVRVNVDKGERVPCVRPRSWGGGAAHRRAGKSLTPAPIINTTTTGYAPGFAGADLDALRKYVAEQREQVAAERAKKAAKQAAQVDA